MDLLHPIGATSLHAVALNNLGEIHLDRGDLSGAEECYIQARDICREMGGGPVEGHALHNLGRVYQLLHRPDDALASYEEALRMHRASGALVGEATTLKHLGEVRAQIGDQAEAAETAEQLASLPLASGLEAAEVAALPLTGEPEAAVGPWHQSDPGAVHPPASGPPVHSVHYPQETPDPAHDSEAASVTCGDGREAGETTAGAGSADDPADGDRAGENPGAGSAPPADEALLAALRVILTAEGVTDREQAAARAAKLIRSWPEPLGLPGPGKAGKNPAPVLVTPDAPGHDERPDPLTAGTPAEFVAALKALRQWAGSPSYRAMEKKCGRAAASATICTALTRDELPSLPVVQAIVTACGCGDDQVSLYTTAWRKLEKKQEPRRQRSKKQPGIRLYLVPDEG